MMRPTGATIVTVLAAAMLLASCDVFDPVDLGSEDDLMSEFELVWRTFDRYYVNFHLSDADWDALHAEYGAMAEQAMSQADIENILFEMCAELEDPGISIGDSSTHPLEVTPNCDSVVLMTYLEPQGFVWMHQDAWGYCMFGNTIYFLLLSLYVNNAELDEVIASHPEIEEMIFDARMSEGDTFGAPLGEICRVFNREAVVGYFTISRSGPGHEDFCPLHPRYVSRSMDSFTGPVAVLIGEGNMHVSEQFACMVSEIPNATTMGDTTMRRPDVVWSYELPGLGGYSMPDSTIIRADSTTWVRQAGVPPDVFVEATEADFAAGVDPVLEHALEWAGEIPIR
ncbi:MAG: S41 family peptidase [Candidatus Fermentibacter sp.]|nr:S41 family peptidase [Candidatus Fermentibacter sp.]